MMSTDRAGYEEDLKMDALHLHRTVGARGVVPKESSLSIARRDRSSPSGMQCERDG